MANLYRLRRPGLGRGHAIQLTIAPRWIRLVTVVGTFAKLVGMALRHHLLALAVVLLASAVAFADDDEPLPQGPPSTQERHPPYAGPQTMQSTDGPQTVALSSPEEITDVEAGRGAPMGYTEVHRPRRHLIVAGAVTLGAAYGVCLGAYSLGKSTGSKANEVQSFLVPFAGPFLEMRYASNRSDVVVLASLGAAEIAGAVMQYFGVTSKRRVFVRNDLVGSLAITPLVDQRVEGLALTGSF